MTALEFRENELLVKAWKHQLAENDILLTVLRVMDDNAPVHNGFPDPSVTPHIAHIQLGIDRGYAGYGRRLRELALYAAPNEPIESTYEHGEEETEE